METYKPRNPFVFILLPAFGVISFFCFYEPIQKAFWVALIPLLLTCAGVIVVVKKFRYRVAIDDSAIRVGSVTIPWDAVTRIVEFKQLTESGSGMRKIKRLSILYESDGNARKSLCVTPKDMNKPTALINSIKKRKSIDTI